MIDPITGSELRYMYVACEHNGYCSHVFKSPKLNLSLYLEDWEQIEKVLKNVKIGEILGTDILQENDVIPFQEDYKIIDYGRTLRIIIIKLTGIRSKPEYLVIKTVQPQFFH